MVGSLAGQRVIGIDLKNQRPSENWSIPKLALEQACVFTLP